MAGAPGAAAAAAATAAAAGAGLGAGRGRAAVAAQRARVLFDRYSAKARAARRWEGEGPPGGGDGGDGEGASRSSLAALAAKVLLGAVGAASLATVAVAGYTLSAVHSRRRRGYTDEFVLTPEDLNMPYQEVQFFTEDGISLTGWFIPQTSGGKPSRRVVVCCHPHNNSKSNLLGVARGLWDRRYSVFMFDFRSFAHTPTGQSVGYFEQRDARAAVAAARAAAPEGAQIGLIGASMGGAVALMVGHEASVNAVGIATDCAFASLAKVLEGRVSNTLRLPPAASSVVVSVADLLNPFLFGYRVADVAPERAVAEGGSDRAGEVPLLLMHAEDDTIVGVSQAHAIHSAAATPRKQLVVLQHCHHVGCFFRDRPGYVRLLSNFFDQAFEEAEARAGASMSPLARAAGNGEPPREPSEE